MKIYDLRKDEFQLSKESTVAREHLLDTLGYDGYTDGRFVARLAKDESQDPNKEIFNTKTPEDFLRLAKNPHVPLTTVAGLLGRKLDDDQLSDLTAARPELTQDPIFIGELVRALPRAAMEQYPKTRDAIFKGLAEHPSAFGLRNLLQHRGMDLPAEDIDKALDLQERFGFRGSVSGFTENRNLTSKHVDRILNPEYRSLYGAPHQNFGGEGVQHLNANHISDIISRGDYFPHLALSQNFDADHMTRALSHPEVTSSAAMKGLSWFYQNKKKLPTHVAANAIKKASRVANLDDDGDLGMIATYAGHQDPQLFDHLDPDTLKEVVDSADRTSSVDALVGAARSTPDSQGKPAPIDASNAPRVAKLLRVAGPRAARAEETGDTWREFMDSPAVSETDKAPLRRYQAQNFWHDYERNVKPEHFAAITKWQQNSPEHMTVQDHRGNVGSSDRYPGIEQAFGQHAKEMQAKVAASPGIPRKDINGIPHVLVYRGIAGDYAHKVVGALSHGAAGVSLPTAAFSSWSLDPEEANAFAGRSIKGHSTSGAVLRRWAPLNTVLHSGLHSLEDGHEPVHASEQELVFDHRHEPELHIPKEDIHVTRMPIEDFDRFKAGKIPMTPDHRGTHDSFVAPHIKAPLTKSESGFVRIPLTDEDHWSNMTSNLRTLPKEL